MIRWAHAMLKDEHPCGTGARKLLAIEYDDGSVTALYPPTLEAKTFPPEAWKLIRASMEFIEHPGPLRVRLMGRREDMKRWATTIAYEAVDEALGLLKEMMPPPPRPRVRVRRG